MVTGASGTTSTGSPCDVAIVGDGPAGSALAAACVAAGLDAVLVGPDRPWTSILGAWVDEVPAAMQACVRGGATPIDVVTRDRRRLDRTYAAIDLAALHAQLRAPLAGGRHVVATVERLWHTTDTSRLAFAGGDELVARLVVDATGLPSALRPNAASSRAPVGWQTAYGLVLDHRPEAVGGEGAVLMDWRQPDVSGSAATDAPTFLYVLPLPAGRWLVEETSLRSTVPVVADVLRARLAARLGADLTDRAEHVEQVRIAMPPGVPSRTDPTVGFGAAARYIHPATGYSVAASLRAADRVAAAIADALHADLPPRRTALTVWNAVWPAAQRTTRGLHDVGAAALGRMQPGELVDFFDAFFALPSARWAGYLRIDAPPSAVGAAMREVFSSASWTLRRRMAASLPVPLLRPRP